MSAKPRPEWADKLERLRAILGVSQAGLAKRLHVSAMAPSRWERGINEPPAEIYIQLGKMVGDPACWYFWEKAGLKRSDLAVSQKKKAATAARSNPSSTVQVYPSAGLRNVKASTPMCAIPLYSTTTGRPEAGPTEVDMSVVTEVMTAPKDWCKHPDDTFCIRISDEAMSPCLRDGYIIAVDQSQKEASKLDGKMVLASHGQKGLVVRWLQRAGKSEMLVPENQDYPATPLAEGGWSILGKVIWWIARAP